MKIGTISLNINAPDFNYGAVLHSWAMQKFLLSLKDVEKSEVIDYVMPSLEEQDLAHPLMNALREMRIKTFFRQIKTLDVYKQRYRKFKEFENNQMRISKDKYTQKSLSVAILDYDCIICESDVIWAPGFSGGHFDRSFFMALKSMENMKKIAYAPSMSDGDLSEAQEQEFEELLRFPDYISCRESYEKNIIEKYTSKEVKHVLDPVMLLEADDYYPICAPRIIPEPYLLLYLPVDDNNRLRRCANIYAAQKGLKVLEISTKQKSYTDVGKICLGAAGIEEFLSAIRYSSVVFTNSFHAICFSIVFNIQFYAFSRAYAGKVKDLCNTFCLEDRYFSDDNFVEIGDIDYSIVNDLWNKRRAESTKWLLNAIFSDGNKE